MFAIGFDPFCVDVNSITGYFVQNGELEHLSGMRIMRTESGWKFIISRYGSGKMITMRAKEIFYTKKDIKFYSDNLSDNLIVIELPIHCQMLISTALYLQSTEEEDDTVVFEG